MPFNYECCGYGQTNKREMNLLRCRHLVNTNVPMSTGLCFIAFVWNKHQHISHFNLIYSDPNLVDYVQHENIFFICRGNNWRIADKSRLKCFADITIYVGGVTALDAMIYAHPMAIKREFSLYTGSAIEKFKLVLVFLHKHSIPELDTIAKSFVYKSFAVTSCEIVLRLINDNHTWVFQLDYIFWTILLSSYASYTTQI